jgi:hypothetical protein
MALHLHVHNPVGACMRVESSTNQRVRASDAPCIRSYTLHARHTAYCICPILIYHSLANITVITCLDLFQGTRTLLIDAKGLPIQTLSTTTPTPHYAPQKILRSKQRLPALVCIALLRSVGQKPSSQRERGRSILHRKHEKRDRKQERREMIQPL